MKIGNLIFDKPLMLAPMEGVTDISFRLICKRLGADLTFTEFVNAEGLTRKNDKTKKKMFFWKRSDHSEFKFMVAIQTRWKRQQKLQRN